MAAVREIRTRIEERAKKAAASGTYKVTIPNTTVTYSLVSIPAGEFLMGSAGPKAKKDEQPQHKVRLDAFWMQAHEVTWDSYVMFMFADQAKESDHPDPLVDGLSRPTAPYVEMSFGRGHGGFPAISMTQHAANKYAQWLSAKTGEFYRLPTEAEWEYACRAGTNTATFAGEIKILGRYNAPALDEIAWYGGNSSVGWTSSGGLNTDSWQEKQYPGGRAAQRSVATRKPNPWGLYDMLGNVWEWCADWYGPQLPGGEVTDPVGPATGKKHVSRGGSWMFAADGSRSAKRFCDEPGARFRCVGFRIALAPQLAQ
jgi:formylglycine-generating enzyme required for sulfatase activity